jgi:hypothetical protein
MFSRKAFFSGTALIIYLAVFKLLLHLSLNGYYGYQRDELYFIACGNRLALGYVDVGPLAMWLGRLSREVLGESLFALRFFSAVAGSLTVLLAGLLARELGGGRFAQGLASLTVVIAPAWLMAGNILSLASFEPLFWTLCAYILVRIIKAGLSDAARPAGASRLWIAFGVVAGFGLLNKPSMAFFGLGVVVGLLLTPNRRYFTDKWLYLGGLTAFVIVSPNLYWQAAHGWPTLEFLVDMNKHVMSRISRIEFVAGQIVYMHPFNLPIWVSGLCWLLFSKQGKPYRPLGWVYVTVFVLLIAAKSKIYYLAPAYPMLLAAGTVAVEVVAHRRNRRWMRFAVPLALAAGGLVTAPVGLPLLPIEKLDSYVTAVTGGILKNAYEVTGTFHDMFGWENQVATVAKIYHGLPPEDQSRCIIFAGNFGQAGAIDFYGKKYGLPAVASIHQNYYFWGPPETSGDVAIVLGVRMDDLRNFFYDIRLAATIPCTECVSYENNVPVYVCRDPTISLKDAWPGLRAIAFKN